MKMKFVDEANIEVVAGKGGDGCMSFRREKYIPFGGPNGGNGGEGGSVYLMGDQALNTLVDFQYKSIFKAGNGQPGMGNQCKGKDGKDIFIRVPIGTIVTDLDTGEVLGEIQKHNEQMMVAKGGRKGIGNIHFKSSTNRAPRRTIPGEYGEKRRLSLELKLLADVGLVGLPNAGKSTLIRSVSAARPKVADYPFTTLRPYLGVVRLSTDQSFVMADIPGIIEGASDGAGLGLQFLKHVSKTHLLLHVADMAAIDGTDPVDAIKQIHQELKKFSPELAKKERWLVFNKMDLIPEEEREERCQKIVKKLRWKAPYFMVSATQNQGTQELVYAIGKRIAEKSYE